MYLISHPQRSGKYSWKERHYRFPLSFVFCHQRQTFNGRKTRQLLHWLAKWELMNSKIKLHSSLFGSAWTWPRSIVGGFGPFANVADFSICRRIIDESLYQHCNSPTLLTRHFIIYTSSALLGEASTPHRESKALHRPFARPHHTFPLYCWTPVLHTREH